MLYLYVFVSQFCDESFIIFGPLFGFTFYQIVSFYFEYWTQWIHWNVSNLFLPFNEETRFTSHMIL